MYTDCEEYFAKGFRDNGVYTLSLVILALMLSVLLVTGTDILMFYKEPQTHRDSIELGVITNMDSVTSTKVSIWVGG